MKYLLLMLSMSILLSAEMEVDGDLKVTGTIQNDSLAQVIANLQTQIALLEAQMAFLGQELNYWDCSGVLGGDAVLDNCGTCDNNSSNDCVLTDLDGNTYETVEIGDQIWMAENLKTTQYNNGNAIETGLDNQAWMSTIEGAYSIYDDDPANAEIYGNLYNWYAVDDDRGICPGAFHVPDDNDWNNLILYLDDNAEIYSSTEQSIIVGGQLQDGEFGALLGGNRYQSNGSYSNENQYGSFWSSLESDDNHSWDRDVYSGNASIWRNYYIKSAGFSVRCIKD